MRKTIEKYVKDWETGCYLNGIPEIAPIRLEQLNKVPSCKTICRAILKNDFHLESLGFKKEKSYLYSSFKKVELQQRPDFLYTLSLF